VLRRVTSRRVWNAEHASARAREGWLDQRLEIREQCRILGDRSLAPSSRSPNSLGRLVLRQFLQARPIVLGATPVAIATAVIPPYPAANASAAATRRRPRSSRKGATAENRSLMGSISITTTTYSIQVRLLTHI
jgi:hypothetical protein